MFNNSLDNILASFTKVQARLDAYANSQEIETEKQEAFARLANGRASEARSNADKARRISSKINNLVSA